MKTKARRFDLFTAHIGNMKIAPRRSNGFTRQKAVGGRFRLLLFKLPVLVGISLRRDCFKGLARNVAINPLVCVNQHLQSVLYGVGQGLLLFGRQLVKYGGLLLLQKLRHLLKTDTVYIVGGVLVVLIWNGGRDREEELLANCYFNSMNLAMDNGIRSIAFPSISTGVYSFPVELAAKIAVHTVNRFLQDNPDSFDLVEWVLFDTHTESVYEAEVDKLYDK